MANQPQLLDLPPAWLGNMSLALGIRKRPLPLARTCKQLQQLVFRQSALRVKLCVLPDSVEGLAEHLVTRALACAEAAEIKLHLYLEGSCVQDDFVNRLLHSAALQHQELVGQCQDSPASLQLHSITAVSLNGRHEHEISFLPDSVVQTCPNLQDLSLDNLTIVASTDEPQHTCTSLQKLSLVSVRLRRDGPSAAFKQRLLDLPNLTALSLEADTGFRDDYYEGGVFYAAICQYYAQLKGLSVGCECQDCMPVPPSKQYPALRELQDGTSSISSDAQLQNLLKIAPNVEYVQLWSIYGLKTSVADTPCTWKHLELYEVNVGQLAKLPLSNCTKLRCLHSLNFSKSYDISADSPSVEQVAAGAAAALAAGGLYSRGAIQIELYTDDLEHLKAAAPLLHSSDLNHVELSVFCPESKCQASWSKTLPLLKVMGEHLKCNEVELSFDEWNRSRFDQLPQLFPNVKGFRLCLSKISEYEVLALIRKASRPFKLRLSEASEEQQQQLQQAVQEAGHHLVTLELGYTFN